MKYSTCAKRKVAKSFLGVNEATSRWTQTGRSLPNPIRRRQLHWDRMFVRVGCEKVSLRLFQALGMVSDAHRYWHAITRLQSRRTRLVGHVLAVLAHSIKLLWLASNLVVQRFFQTVLHELGSNQIPKQNITGTTDGRTDSIQWLSEGKRLDQGKHSALTTEDEWTAENSTELFAQVKNHVGKTS